MLFAAALIFTGCSNDSGSDGGGTPPTSFAVTFGVDGGNGTLKAEVGGTEINSGDAVEKGKIVTFTAKKNDDFVVDKWSVSHGSFESGTGTEGNNTAKVTVTAAVTVKVSFKAKPAGTVKYTVEHHKQNVTGDEYTKAEEETKYGKPAENTQAEAKTYEGFNAKPIIQKTIAEDGTTVVKVYYDRKEISLSLNLDGGGTSTPLTDGKLKGRFEAPVTVADPTKAGYAFDGWTPPLPATFPAEDGTHTAQWKALTKITFSVEGGNGTLKAKADGGTETETSPISVEKGKTVTFTANPDSGYKVKEWKADGVAVPGNTTNSYAFTVTKAADVKVSFEALPPGEASYTVKHYQEGTDGNYPAEPTESENKSGTSGDPVVYTPKTGGAYEGFTYNSALTKVNGIVQTAGTIAADGSTVVKLYYERNTVNVTFKLAGGNIAGNATDVVKSGKYGTALEVPADPVKADSVFKGWTPALPSPLVFPAANAEYTANWALLYTINFSVDGGNGTLTAKVDGSGISSGDTVEQGKTVVFTATPANTNFAVDKWTNGGSDIPEAGANETYNHTVTADANIKVKFKYTGADLALSDQEFTKEMGQSFTYKLVTAGSGSYTATPETAGIISLGTANLNSHGNITVTCINAGTTKIRITDTSSGQTALSGTITVTPAVVIPDYFAEAGVRYHVTDKTPGQRKVSVTAKTGPGTHPPYTGTTLFIPKEVIHNSVTYTVTGVEELGYWGTTLQSVTVAPDNAYLSSQDGVLFNNDNNNKTVLLWYPRAKTDASYSVPPGVIKLERGSFRDVPALQTITLPGSLKRIEAYVFTGCPNIATLVLPTSLEFIGDNSMNGLKVTSMVVPENVKALDGYCLSSCNNLASVELPSTLKQITWYSFSHCPALTTVTCRAATPPDIAAGGNVFGGSTPIASATLKVPSGTESAYRTAEGWKDFGTIVAITP
ncbi:leucine-rich repeat protein [Treponema sp. SP13]|uniref:leucine-rich repeat protein n=1 Tax=Treponema sp. SP13 TaxID=2789742 RepID=UPI003D93684F